MGSKEANVSVCNAAAAAQSAQVAARMMERNAFRMRVGAQALCLGWRPQAAGPALCCGRVSVCELRRFMCSAESAWRSRVRQSQCEKK